MSKEHKNTPAPEGEARPEQENTAAQAEEAAAGAESPEAGTPERQEPYTYIYWSRWRRWRAWPSS